MFEKFRQPAEPPAGVDPDQAAALPAADMVGVDRRKFLRLGMTAGASAVLGAGAMAVRDGSALQLLLSQLELTPYGGVVDGVVEANAKATQQHWPDTPASITELQLTKEPDVRRSATFVSGGLGTLSAVKEAQSLATSLRNFGRVVALNYASESLGEDQLADDINRFIYDNRIEKAIFHGESMGGIVQTQLFPRLNLVGNYMRARQIRGLGRPAAKVVGINYDCSPVDEADVLDRGIRALAILHSLGLKGGGGLAGKWATQVWLNLIGNPNQCDSLREQYQTALRDTFSSVPPKLGEAQAMTVFNSTQADFTDNLSTVDYDWIAYLRAANDTVVNDDTASEKVRLASSRVQRLQRRTGATAARFTVANLGPVGHAGATSHPKVYNAALAPVAVGKPPISVKGRVVPVDYRSCRR